jgi:putative two-component system response regulator
VDGFTVCDWIKGSAETRLLPVLMVTAQSDQRHRVRRAQVDADDILYLPVDRLEFLARVRSLLRLKAYHRDLEDRQSVLLALAALLEARDPYQRGHSTRVGDIALQLGRELGLTEEQCEGLRMAGLLHDIGTLAVPERVLAKPGPLDEQERARVRAHSGLGAELIASLKTVREVLALIRHHHERFDGSGYPDGLAGENIPLGARILGLADAYDALTSDRAHRPRLPADQAVEVLVHETASGLWDPRVLAALQTLVTPTR